MLLSGIQQVEPLLYPKIRLSYLRGPFYFFRASFGFDTTFVHDIDKICGAQGGIGILFYEEDRKADLLFHFLYGPEHFLNEQRGEPLVVAI